MALGQVFSPIITFSRVSTFFSNYFSFPRQYHSTKATYSFIYHPRCIMFFSQYFSFPLSVSFHQCSILIHSSTTHAAQIFSQYVSFPVSIIPPTLHTHSFIYHPRCIIFFSQHFIFPCQNHSTIAPISPTMYYPYRRTTNALTLCSVCSNC